MSNGEPLQIYSRKENTSQECRQIIVPITDVYADCRLQMCMQIADMASWNFNIICIGLAVKWGDAVHVCVERSSWVLDVYWGSID